MPRRCIPLIVDGKVVGRAQIDVPNRNCSSCGRPGADIRCDYPVKTKSGTCDRWLCKRCAVSVGPDWDYCPVHDRIAKGAVR